jgi:hypothetical protein
VWQVHLSGQGDRGCADGQLDDFQVELKGRKEIFDGLKAHGLIAIRGKMKARR